MRQGGELLPSLGPKLESTRGGQVYLRVTGSRPGLINRDVATANDNATSFITAQAA